MAEIISLGGLPGHERKGGGFQTGYEVYSPEGIAPTVLANGGGYGIMVVTDEGNYDKTRQDKTRQDNDCDGRRSCQVVVIGQMDNTIDHTFESANLVYDKQGLCPTIPTCAGGGIQPKIIEERRMTDGGKPVVIDVYNNRRIDGDVCGTITAHGNASTTSCGTFGIVEDAEVRVAAMRGRGEGWKQRLEVGSGEVTNALTTVQKDNLLIESKKSDCKVVGGLGEKKSNGGTQYYQQDRVYHGDIQPAQPAQLQGGSYNFLLKEAERYRIRKLTPRECWRLMGFSDADFEKAESVNSNSQLYKEAGNAIVRQVLMAIFLQMNIQGLKNWNDRTDEERRR